MKMGNQTGPAKSPLRGLRLLIHRLMGWPTTRLDGLTLVCDPAKIDRSVAAAIIKGSYEAPEREFVRASVRPGDRVVELGAGAGVVSLLCSKLAYPGKVHSFEANAAMEPVIRENFALNGMEPCLTLRAVTVDGAPISFFKNANVVSSSLYDRGLEAQKITVESVAIEKVLRVDQPTVLIMDVEGAEIDLLEAADLSGVREIVVELHPHIVGHDATNAMIAQVCAKGFVETSRIYKNLRLTRIA